MRVADVLKSNRQSLATCIPEESIKSICTRLSALNIGAFPVCDAHGALVGIISERDVVRAATEVIGSYYATPPETDGDATSAAVVPCDPAIRVTREFS